MFCEIFTEKNNSNCHNFGPHDPSALRDLWVSSYASGYAVVCVVPLVSADLSVEDQTLAAP